MTANSKIYILAEEKQTGSKRTFSRLNYVCTQIFCDWYGREYEIVSKADDDCEIIISYSDNASQNENILNVYRDDSEINVPSEVSEWKTSDFKELPIFYDAKKQRKNYDIPFDIFKAVFFLISRFEEYDSADLDKHGRYDYRSSLAYRFNFLNRPLIDEWLKEFEKTFNAKFPDSPLIPKKSPHLITIDVDNVFAYKNKGIIRHCFNFLKESAQGKFSDALKRTDVLFGKEPDPFFNIEEIADKLPKESVMFFHCGCYGKYDKKTIIPSISYWKAKQRIDKKINVGLHPSYRSANCKTLLRIEKWILEKCLGRKVTAVRMHYLLFYIPKTARMLIDLGITDDYSMAYSNIAGFRASTARSFRFYDLEREEATNLTIHPLIVMDKTLRSNMGLMPKDAIEFLDELRALCDAANVPLTTLFHNENLADMNGWREWKEVFEWATANLSMSENLTHCLKKL